MGLKVEGLEFRVPGVGLSVWGSGFGILGSGVWFECFEFVVWGLGCVD